MSSLSPDMIPVLAEQPGLSVAQSPGTNFGYLGFNLEDPILAKREVRQALAFATDREALIHYLLRGEARIASGILPPNPLGLRTARRAIHSRPARAEKILDAAGFPRQQDGMRFHLTLKVSTEEQARLIGAVLQEQWRRVGVDLELRPLELATLLSDAARGNFQLTYSRWVGANNDPDVFEFVFFFEAHLARRRQPRTLPQPAHRRASRSNPHGDGS